MRAIALLEVEMPDDPQPLHGHVTAVCCSGGGIRSASFNLGALQALTDRKLLERVSVMTAVSGGSYIAAAHRLVAARLTEGEPAYSPRSPEERHLREHTHYLAPTPAVGLRAFLCLLFGLAMNLSLLIAWILLVTLPIGWLLSSWGQLPATSQAAVRLGWLPWIPGALTGVVLLLFALSGAGASRLHARWHRHGRPGHLLPPAQGCSTRDREQGMARWVSCGGVQDAMWLAFVGAVLSATLVVAAPHVVAWANQTGASRLPSTDAGVSGSLASFFAGILVVARIVLGRIGGAKPAAPDTGSAASTALGGRLSGLVKTSLWPRVKHAVLPWVGTLIAVGLLFFVAVLGERAGWRSGPNRWQYTALAGAVGWLLVTRLLVDVNRTSWHSFYRDRLASAYAVEREAPDAVRAAGQRRLSELAPEFAPAGDGAAPGTPGGSDPGVELVVCATANVTASGEVPAGTGGVSFTFTPHSAGLERPVRPRPESEALYRRVPMDAYERALGPRQLTLFDTVAMSGAAISPVMGSMTRAGERFVLAIANVRLGVWLPHPALMPDVDDASPVEQGVRMNLPADRLERQMVARLGSRSGRRLGAVLARRLQLSRLSEHGCMTPRRRERCWNELCWRAAQPNVRMLLAEALGRLSLSRHWLYVTDGGHYDNLGLVEALRRRPSEIFVFDASGDSVATWSTLGQAVALSRSELGATIDIDPTVMARRGSTPTAGAGATAVSQPFARGTYTLPAEGGHPEVSGVLWVTKLGVWPEAPWDVQAYARRHATFPTDSTLQQLYDGQEFEAYRQLGYSAATAMLAAREHPTCDGRVAQPSEHRLMDAMVRVSVVGRPNGSGGLHT